MPFIKPNTKVSSAPFASYFAFDVNERFKKDCRGYPVSSNREKQYPTPLCVHSIDGSLNGGCVVSSAVSSGSKVLGGHRVLELGINGPCNRAGPGLSKGQLASGDSCGCVDVSVDDGAVQDLCAGDCTCGNLGFSNGPVVDRPNRATDRRRDVPLVPIRDHIRQVVRLGVIQLLLDVDGLP